MNSSASEEASLLVTTASIDDPLGVVAALAGLASSTDPEVVFESLASLCVPAFSDGCKVSLQSGVELPNQLSHRQPEPADDSPRMDGLGAPPPSTGQVLSAHSVSTQIVIPQAGDNPASHGVVVHSWRSGAPTPSDAAFVQLMVERAVSVIGRARLVDKVNRLADDVEQLQAALTTSREIGAAMGILMATQLISQQQAFAQLRTTSQRCHRKLHEVASDVVLTGAIDTSSVGEPLARALSAIASDRGPERRTA